MEPPASCPATSPSICYTLQISGCTNLLSYSECPGPIWLTRGLLFIIQNPALYHHLWVAYCYSSVNAAAQMNYLLFCATPDLLTAFQPMLSSTCVLPMDCGSVLRSQGVQAGLRAAGVPGQSSPAMNSTSLNPTPILPFSVCTIPWGERGMHSASCTGG